MNLKNWRDFKLHWMVPLKPLLIVHDSHTMRKWSLNNKIHLNGQFIRFLQYWINDVLWIVTLKKSAGILIQKVKFVLDQFTRKHHLRKCFWKSLIFLWIFSSNNIKSTKFSWECLLFTTLHTEGALKKVMKMLVENTSNTYSKFLFYKTLRDFTTCSAKTTHFDVHFVFRKKNIIFRAVCRKIPRANTKKL